MTRSSPFIIAIFLIGLGVTIRAQFMTVEMRNPYVAPSPSGVVVDSNDAPLPGATVKRMTAGWKALIEVTQADSKGYFSFLTKSTLNYLEITTPGFQVMHVKLRTVGRKTKRPRIRVEIAT